MTELSYSREKNLKEKKNNLVRKTVHMDFFKVEREFKISSLLYLEFKMMKWYRFRKMCERCYYSDKIIENIRRTRRVVTVHKKVFYIFFYEYETNTQIAILTCSKLAASSAWQACKFTTRLQQVNASLVVTMTLICSKLVVQVDVKLAANLLQTNRLFYTICCIQR